jgi:hypothetical protein
MKTKPKYRKAIIVGLLIATGALSLVGCRTTMTAQNHSGEAPDFSRETMLKADIALKEAMRCFDREIGLDRCKCRIDMRRVQEGWRVTFIYLPEAPDYSGVVVVYDNGKIESFLK